MRKIVAAFAGLVACFAFAAAARAGTFQTLYAFQGLADGAAPYGKLVMDSVGVLYGVTVSGGTQGRGNIYSFDPATGLLTNLYSFTGGADGGNPQNGLALDGAGHLYGVTPRGGLTVNCSLGCGTVFKLTIATQKLTTLYRFGGVADGSTPLGALTPLNGALYGTTAYGGLGAGCPSQGCGTIFKYALAGKTFATMHTFVPADGVDPQAKLVRAPSGLLYGTATSAGAFGSGTVFSVDPASATFSVVHNFDYHVDGSSSGADLVVRNGLLFGTMTAGGPTANGDGTVYRLDPATGVVTTLYSFTGQADGLFPTYGVAFGPTGRLYGTTDQGGTGSVGTMFQLNPTTLAFATVHTFTSAGGSFPASPPLVVGGAIYGVTSGNLGTIYKYVP